MSDPSQTNPTTSETTDRDPTGRRRLWLLVLWTLAAALFVALISCAAESNGHDSDRDSTSGTDTVRGSAIRLMLGGVSSHDSIAMVGDFHVDQIMRQVLDSIDGVDYIRLNVRDSLALASDSGSVRIGPAFDRLHLNGIVFAQLARFGDVLALQMRVVDSTGRTDYSDLVFTLIRYRDSVGDMLIGPALYDAVRAALGRYLGRQQDSTWHVAREAIVPVSIEIDRGAGRIGKERTLASAQTLRALAEYADRHIPEITAFSPSARNRLYEATNVGTVEDYGAFNDIERGALYGVGIDRYLVGSYTHEDADSSRLRLELHALRSRTDDEVIDTAEATYSPLTFETSTGVEDFEVAMIDLVERIYVREAERVRTQYRTSLQKRQQ